MALSLLVSVEEYPGPSYRPDCDYVDGEVVARNSGEFEHRAVQREIMLCLAANDPGLRQRLQPGQRVQVKLNRFRIPAICILAAGVTPEPIIQTPPELCIEILSPEDSLTRILERTRDYFAMGVPLWWIVNPLAAKAG